MISPLFLEEEGRGQGSIVFSTRRPNFSYSLEEESRGQVSLLCLAEESRGQDSPVFSERKAQFSPPLSLGEESRGQVSLLSA